MKILRWIIGFVMLLPLAGGAFCVFAANSYLVSLPQSVGALEKVTLTVKALVIGPNLQILTPQEYQTQFEVAGTSPVEGVSPMAVPADASSTDGDAVIHIGDHADVYLSKQNAAMLQNKAAPILPLMMAYGITMSDGRVLSDPAEIISGGPYREMKMTGIKLTAVPILYFLSQIVTAIVRRKHRRKA